MRTTIFLLIKRIELTFEGISVPILRFGDIIAMLTSVSTMCAKTKGRASWHLGLLYIL